MDEPHYQTIVDLRRTLHMRPELSGDEAQTAALVARRLTQLGLQVEAGIGGYGVVGILEGGRPGPTVAYRADMDALPMRDTLDTDYASQHLAIKHACGHDAHTAIAVGIATHLSEMRAALPGRVAFIFQPAEESLDGARAMLADGLLAELHPAAILALHAFPMPVGTVGVATGRCLAGMEEFRVRFYAPAGNLEALVAESAARLTELSTAAIPQDAASFARTLDAMARGDPGLADTIFVSCWPETSSGDPTAQSHLLGLVSLTDFAQRAAVRDAIDRVLGAAAANYGATYDITYPFSNPPLSNDGPLVARIAPLLEAELGPAQVRYFSAPYPFAHEDFTHFAARVPAAFVWLGTQNLERGIPSILHTPDYDIDERALSVGVEAMTAVIRGLLRNPRWPSERW